MKVEEQTQNRIWLIDLLKGIAALSVVVLHIFLPDRVRQVLLIPFWCNLAVPIFITVSGFTFSLSSKKYSGGTPREYLANYFCPAAIIKKIKRVYAPFLAVYAVEIIGCLLRGEHPSALHIIKCLFIGGFTAPGAYFIPVLVQIIIVFPFISLLYNKIKSYSFLVIGAIQIIYELAVLKFNVPDSITRMTAFRYLLFLLCGIWLYCNYNKKIKVQLCILPMVLGAGWIIAIGYLNYQPTLFGTWKNTSFPVLLWYVPIMLILFNKFAGTELRHKSIICKFGQASYHIYLVQMLYFLFVGNRFGNDFVNTVVALVACSTVGTLFYLAEQKINAYIKKKRLSK